MFKYIQLFVYGIITPSIIGYSIYYTFSESLKIALKDAIDKSIKQNIKETLTIFTPFSFKTHRLFWSFA